MSTDALELYCRNMARSTGELAEYDRTLLFDVSARLCAIQAENAEKNVLLLEITAQYGAAVKIQAQIAKPQKRAEAAFNLVQDYRTCENRTPWCEDNLDGCKGYKWRGAQGEG